MKFSKLVFILILQIGFNPGAKSQCNIAIINLPDTILACKNTTVALNPSVYTTSGTPYYVDTFWTPATGLSDPNIINPIAVIGTSSVQYNLTVQAVTPLNLIYNGDFSLGDTGFSSSYVYGTGGVWGLLSMEGQYAIATNPLNTHINFASFGDHTSGTGNMLVVNGASAPNVNIWCQTISVNPNTWYDFSAWGATCVASNPAVLQFSINGSLVGAPLALPLITGVWTQFHATWYSGTNTSINICITNQATALSGNDFAIDDIAFKEICTVTDSVFINVVNLTPGIQAQYHLGCEEDTLQFSALDGSGNIPATYLWNFGDGNFSTARDPQHIYATQGIYNVTLITSLNGCQDSSTMVINTLHPIVADFGVQDTFCVGQVVTTADNSVTTGPTAYSWDWGDGTNSTTNTHTYSIPGQYTITLVLTDTLGCTDTSTEVVHILDAPYAYFTLTEKILCQGETVFLDDSNHVYNETWQWDFGDGKQLNQVHSPAYRYDLPGIYIITLTATNKYCPASVFIEQVEVMPYPDVNLGPDTAVCPGITGSLLLTNTLNPAAIYSWSTGETSNAISVNEPGIYWVTATTPGSDCSTTDSIRVLRDCYLNIPNSFTPNGDGRNDYFIPREFLSAGIISFSMNIFNRWGETIFTSNQINGRGWDGKYGGKDQPMGVYVYVIQVQFKNGIRKEFTGNVTLIR